MQTLVTTGLLALGTVLMVLAAQRAVGYGLKHGFTAIRCVMVSSLTLFGLLIFTLVITSLATQQNVLSLWAQDFELSLSASVEFYQSLGWNLEEVERAAGLIRRFFLEAILGWLAVAILAFSAASYFVQRRLAPRSPGAAIPVAPFSHWAAPDKLIWVLLSSLVLLGLGTRGMAILDWLGLNALIVVASIYLVIGLSVIFYYFNKKGLPRALKIGAVLLLGLIPALFTFVVLLGIFDIWWDWRRLKKTPEPPPA